MSFLGGNLLAYIFTKGYFKCSQTKVDLILEEISDALLFFIHLVEVGLARNAQSACFGSTGKVYRRSVCFG